MQQTMLVMSPAEAKRNRYMVANRLNTIGYVQQELLRARCQTGEPKPERLLVADYGDLPIVLPNHYHPFAQFRLSDGRGRKAIMQSWLGEIGVGLDNGAIKYGGSQLEGEIEFEPTI